METMIAWVVNHIMRELKKFSLTRKDAVESFFNDLNKGVNYFVSIDRYYAYIEIAYSKYYRDNNLEKTEISKEIVIKISEKLKKKYITSGLK
jgi:hypothetical protein